MIVLDVMGLQRCAQDSDVFRLKLTDQPWVLWDQRTGNFEVMSLSRRAEMARSRRNKEKSHGAG